LFRLDGNQRFAYLDFLAFADMDLHDLARMGAGNFDHRFVGLQFDDRLVRMDLVALGNQDINHIGRLDVFA
jgi:hypothetical protein